ncbi:MAG TPA: hypothetical protein VF556_17540 [Pyrinomonadaceae bacterium]|jgi:hypothetical protein
MKHDVESYKADLVKAFDGKAKMTGVDLVNKLAKIRKIRYDEAYNIYAYCRASKIVKAEHVVSHTYNISLNF